jgi:CheY-like chemotaxis protein
MVEDDEAHRSAMRKLLERGGCEVLEVGDGLEALTLLTVRRPDLILLDLNLPVMDGYRVMELLDSDPRFRDIPVVVLSSEALDGTTVNRLTPSIRDYFRKGQVDGHHIVRRILEVLGP